MTVTYDNATASWTIVLDPNDVAWWPIYRARLKDVRHEPITNKEAMRILVNDAWKTAKQWTRTATKEARERAYAAVDQATQDAAKDAATAAADAVIGFDPEA